MGESTNNKAHEEQLETRLIEAAQDYLACKGIPVALVQLPGSRPSTFVVIGMLEHLPDMLHSAICACGRYPNRSDSSQPREFLKRQLCRLGRERLFRGAGQRADLGPTAACHEQQLSGTAHLCLERCPSARVDIPPSRYTTDTPMPSLLIATPLRCDGRWWRSLGRSAAQLRALTFS